MFPAKKYRDPRTLSKCSLVLIMVATIFATVTAINDLAITPAADYMYGEYGSLTSFILSGPSLFIVFSSLATGLLLTRFSKKTVIVAGGVLFAVGGIASALLLHSSMAVCIARSLVGIATGMVITCCTAIIAEVFQNENKRGFMMGVWNAGMGLAGITVSFAAAALVSVSWQDCFKIYWIAIPLLLVLILFIPRTAPDSKKSEEGESTRDTQEALGSSGRSSRFSWQILLAGNMVVFFVAMLVKCGFYFLNAVYIADAGIGTASLAGIAGACINIGSLVGCLAFGFIYAKAKRYIVLAIFSLMTIAYGLLAFVPAVPTCLAASLFLGFGNALAMTYFQTHVSVFVPPAQTSLALGITNATMGAGQFIAPYFAYFVMDLIGGNMVSYSAVATVISVAGMAGGLVFLLIRKRSHG